MVSGKDPLKEIILGELELIAAGVQAMDQIYIKELHKSREIYTNEQVFVNVLRVVTTAAEGVGLLKLLHKYCHLTQEDMDYTEELMKGYRQLENDLTTIYRKHSKK